MGPLGALTWPRPPAAHPNQVLGLHSLLWSAPVPVGPESGPLSSPSGHSPSCCLRCGPCAHGDASGTGCSLPRLQAQGSGAVSGSHASLFQRPERTSIAHPPPLPRTPRAGLLLAGSRVPGPKPSSCSPLPHPAALPRGAVTATPHTTSRTRGSILAPSTSRRDGRNPPERGGWSVGAAQAQITRSTGLSLGSKPQDWLPRCHRGDPNVSLRARPGGEPALSRAQCRHHRAGLQWWKPHPPAAPHSPPQERKARARDGGECFSTARGAGAGTGWLREQGKHGGRVHRSVRSADTLARGGSLSLDRTRACTPRLENGPARHLGPEVEAQGPDSR